MNGVTVLLMFLWQVIGVMIARCLLRGRFRAYCVVRVILTLDFQKTLLMDC